MALSVDQQKLYATKVCFFSFSSEVWGLVPYLEATLEKRERIADSLPLQLQKVCLSKNTKNTFSYYCLRSRKNNNFQWSTGILH